GRNLDLHPFVVMVSVLFGAALAGLPGVLLAAPTVATVRLFIMYVWGKLVERDLFAQAKSVRLPVQEDAILPSAEKPALGEPEVPDREGEVIQGSNI
ncbi:MAG: AI-2E family transporter, partial [Anaerolineae bacterium]|nr:AI-2E family transporter [Anaerolineae bacterium]